MTMKAEVFEVTFKTHNDLLDLCMELELLFLLGEGVLNDAYFIKAEKSITLYGIKPTEYIVAFPQYQNPNSNRAMLMMTNSLDDVLEIAKEYELVGEIEGVF